MSENIQTVLRFCEAFSRRDPEEILGFFSEDAVYHNMPMPPVGKAGIKSVLDRDGNGRVARALATYVMYATGYDFRRFHSWETYLNADIKSYTNALAASLGEHYYHTRATTRRGSSTSRRLWQ
jgi:SnoaL-like domain